VLIFNLPSHLIVVDCSSYMSVTDVQKTSTNTVLCFKLFLKDMLTFRLIRSVVLNLDADIRVGKSLKLSFK